MKPDILLPLLYLVCVSVATEGAENTVAIQSPSVTNWGDWSEWDVCNPGKFVVGFQLKTEKEQGDADDTALNGIKLQCAAVGSGRDDSVVHSTVGEWGDWGRYYRCPIGSVITGYQLRSESEQDQGDDTAANNLFGFCSSSITSKKTDAIVGDGLAWGDWSERRDCPSGYGICGIRTQVESNQGSGDDTSLNNVAMLCCPLPYLHRLLQFKMLQEPLSTDMGRSW